MFKAYYIKKTFTFNAYHAVKIGKNFEKSHMHQFYVGITYKGQKDQNGIVVDFDELNRFIEEKILNKLDKKDLNRIFSNPTTENLAEFIWTKALNFNKNVKLYEVKVCETPQNCIYIRESEE